MALEMTFACDHVNCPSEETCEVNHDYAIKEDLEVDLLERGWIILRMREGEFVYCSLTCLTGPVVP